MPINISNINNTDRSILNNLQDGKINLKNGDLITATVMRRLPDGGMLLSVDGKQLSVLTDLDLPEGSRQLFQAVANGSRIELKPVEGRLSGSGRIPSSMAPSATKEVTQSILQDARITLKDGEIIKATVSGKTPEGGMLLSVNGRPLNVLTGLDLPEGSKQFFQVSQDGSKIELRLVEGQALKPDQPLTIPSPGIAKETFTNNIREGRIVLKNGETVNLTVADKSPGGEVLLSANGKQISALTGLNPVEGERYIFQINQDGSKIELRLVEGQALKPDQPLTIPSPGIAKETFPNNIREGRIILKNGETINLTVADKPPEEGVLLSANGRQLSALTGMNLPEEERYIFQINQAGSKIEIRLFQGVVKSDQPVTVVPSGVTTETMAGVLTELKGALEQAGLPRTTALSAQDLRQLLPSILYTNPKDHNGLWIKENIMASGIFWEGKIADIVLNEKDDAIKKALKTDLKGILLSIEKDLGAEEGKGDDALATKIKHAINLIDGNQQLNLAAVEEGLGWLFFIPGLEEDGFIRGEIFAKKGDKKGGMFFSVLLEFTRLGRFQVNVNMIQDGISVRILMDSEEKADIVKKDLPVLEKGLKALGIKGLALSCDVRRQDENAGVIPPAVLARAKRVNIVI